MNNASNNLAPGDVVSGLESSELVEIQRVVPFGGKTLVEGVGLQSRRLVKRPLAAGEHAALVKVRGRDHTFDGDAELFLLGVEAERIRIAHQFDPLFAVNSSIVDPLPHQVEAVYRYLLPLPRIRFLLADDTGAGKTIMTGLLIKELLFRGVLQKVLIITPAGLTKQWAEEELQEKFGLYARLVNRASFEAEPGQFSRYEEGIFVTSIDFLTRNEGCLKAASETQWDLVVVGEAHKLSAYEYGTKLEESERYKAVKALARKTDHLLLLTATPHRGRKNTFRRLLLLLDEDLFPKDEHVADRVREDAALTTASNERAARLMALQKKTSLASRLDLRSARELRDASDERRLQPLFIRRFFERAWTACGGTVRKDDHFPVWHIGPTPTALLELARERRQSLSDNYDTPFVFDKQLLSVASKVRVPERTKLMGPGHLPFMFTTDSTLRGVSIGIFKRSQEGVSDGN